MKRLWEAADFVRRLHRRVSSVAMRAKLCGFHFSLEDGVLKPLRPRSAVLDLRLSK
jgi:hypothetical protein